MARLAASHVLRPHVTRTAAGWRLVVEEVLQLGEPVARLAPAAAPGMLLAGVGSGLAAYRLVLYITSH